MDTQYSRIGIIRKNYIFIDNNGDKHIIYQIRKYVQKYFAIYISGDEGSRFRLNTWRFYWLPMGDNVFYIEDYNNLYKEICE